MIVIRYADDDLIAQEEFIGLSVVDSIDAATLTAVIKTAFFQNEFTIAQLSGSVL